MAARQSWQGHLRLSLVTCPVALYPATSEADTVRFNLINPETNNRIKMKTVDAGTGDEVSRSDLVKGFAIAKNQYVLLDKEDFESVKLESTRIIDIESFVPAASIDRLYWDTPCHLVPSGKTGIEAFAVIREAMEKKRTIAIGRLVMSTRERICALEPGRDEIVLTTLRTREEVRDVEEVGPIDLPKADPRMLDIAEKIIDQQRGDFNPRLFADRYEQALRDVIQRKREGMPVAVAADEVQETNVVNLMDALRRSLGSAGGESLQKRPRAANRNKPAKPKARPGKRVA
ncbi:MAG TPA: Ku protein [Gemmatimonadales bacterium]|nr:Ku protein [Gemmatimonadales bacterium]